MLARNIWEDDGLYFYDYTNSFQMNLCFNLKSQQKLCPSKRAQKSVTATNQEKIPGKSSIGVMPLSNH